jgi:hypothetical protein
MWELSLYEFALQVLIPIIPIGITLYPVAKPKNNHLCEADSLYLFGDRSGIGFRFFWKKNHDDSNPQDHVHEVHNFHKIPHIESPRIRVITHEGRN